VDEKARGVRELVRIMKPNTDIFMIVLFFAAKEIASLLRNSNCDVTTETCWNTFLPLVLIKGHKRPGANIAETAVILKNTENSLSINDGGESYVEANEDESLLNNNNPPARPTRLPLRVALLAFLFLFMVGFVVAVFVAWPYFDIPKALPTTNRLTSGFFMPISTSFVLLWWQMSDTLKQTSTEPGITSPAIIAKFFKYVGGAMLGACIFNAIFWLPGMFINLYMVDHNISKTTSSLVTTGVNVIIIFAVVRISMYVTKRNAKAK